MAKNQTKAKAKGKKAIRERHKEDTYEGKDIMPGIHRDKDASWTLSSLDNVVPILLKSERIYHGNFFPAFRFFLLRYPKMAGSTRHLCPCEFQA